VVILILLPLIWLDLRRDTVLALKKLGIRVEYSHHEAAVSQHEIDIVTMMPFAWQTTW
jgi:glutamine synthetase